MLWMSQINDIEQENAYLQIQEKGGDAYGSIPKNRGSLQDHGPVPVLSAAGLQGWYDPARQERRGVLHQCPGAHEGIGREPGGAFGVLK